MKLQHSVGQPDLKALQYVFVLGFSFQSWYVCVSMYLCVSLTFIYIFNYIYALSWLYVYGHVFL